MAEAASYLADHEVLFIGTNPDGWFPAGNLIIPGEGIYFIIMKN